MQVATDRPNTDNPELALTGRFDAFETEAFRELIDGLLAGSATSLSVVMSDVVFVDSSGLAELIRAMKHCRERNGDLFIIRPSDPVRVIFELTHLDAAFTILES